MSVQLPNQTDEPDDSFREYLFLQKIKRRRHATLGKGIAWWEQVNKHKHDLGDSFPYTEGISRIEDWQDTRSTVSNAIAV